MSDAKRSGALDGDGVCLRPLAEDDVPLLTRWMFDPDVLHWLQLSEDPEELRTEEAVRERFEQMQADPFTEIWRIEGAEGRPVGQIELVDIHPLQRRAEMHLLVGEKDVWGRGYGTRAVRRLLGHAFDDLGLRRVFAMADEDNLRVIRLFESCGFGREGLLRRHRLRHGRPVDMAMMGILEDEYRAANHRPVGEQVPPDPPKEPSALELEPLLDAVLARIDRDELVHLTRELVRIPSVYRPEELDGNEARAARFVADYLKRAGFEVQTQEVAPGRPNVWAVWEGNRPGRTLLFEAHTDVVTEGRAEDWMHAPFGAERVEGRVYGRGACDTKGNLAAAVVAVRAIKDSGIPFPGRLVLCHPVDEEGMMGGIKAFVDGGHAAGVDAAVICEPEENQLCIKQKGALRLGITVRGRMAHGAMPASGINPVTRAARFVVAVEGLEREEVERHGEDPFLGYPSLTPTILMGPASGEPQINVIPAGAYVALDIRTAPGQSHEKLVGRLEEILANLKAEDPDFDAALEVIDERPPTETPKEEPLVEAMAAAYTRLTGEEPRYNGVPGATDGTFLHAWAGIPIVTTGAGDREMPHHTDEWVDEEELFAACKLYAATAVYYCYGKDARV